MDTNLGFILNLASRWANVKLSCSRKQMGKAAVEHPKYTTCVENTLEHSNMTKLAKDYQVSSKLCKCGNVILVNIHR